MSDLLMQYAASARKSAQDEIDRLKAAEADALRQVEEGKADVSTAMAKVSELDSRSKAQDKEIGDLKAQLATASEDAKSKLAAANDEAAKIRAQLDAANRAKADTETAAN